MRLFTPPNLRDETLHHLHFLTVWDDSRLYLYYSLVAADPQTRRLHGDVALSAALAHVCTVPAHAFTRLVRTRLGEGKVCVH